MNTHCDNIVQKELNFHKCVLCNKTFSKEKELRHHFTTAVHENLKQFKCAICDEEFSQQLTLEDHIKKVHKVLKY